DASPLLDSWIKGMESGDASPHSKEKPLLPFRVGLGHDTHRLAEGGPLRIGGIEIPHDRHAVGHSDADVLLHALTDALLGAAALGDIGEMFPNTDDRYRGISSLVLLGAVGKLLREKG